MFSSCNPTYSLTSESVKATLNFEHAGPVEVEFS